MVPVLNCPLEDVVPVKYCPEDLLHRIRPFWTLSHEDLFNDNCESLCDAIAEAIGDSDRAWGFRKTAGIHACMNAVMILMEQFTGYESDSDSEAR
ncbi:hypothetical protein IWQ61_010636, partial [Dispira simplex]